MFATRFAPAKCGFSVAARRHLSAYGYIQSKALMYSDYGEPKDVLKLHSHSISPASGTQCNLRMLAAPMNPADINQIQGVYPAKPTFNTLLGTNTPSAVAGNEGAFEVVSTGAGVKGLQKGDWVMMKRNAQGTWRTHAQFDEGDLIKVENREGLTPLQVGTISINPVTAYRMIKDFCDWDWLRAPGGEWLIQNGANSGVGRAAIQLARVWGLKTLNVVRERDTPEQTEALKKDLMDIGATAVVTEAEILASGHMREHLNTITRGGKEPIRLALNCVGGKSASAMAKYLAPNSHFVTYGAMAKQPLTLPAGLLIFKNIAFNGFWVSRWSDSNPRLKMDTINDVLQLTRAGKFKDIPSQEVKWSLDSKQEDLAAQAQQTLEGKKGAKGVFVFEDVD